MPIITPVDGPLVDTSTIHSGFLNEILTEEVLKLDSQILAASGTAEDLMGSTLLVAVLHSGGRLLSVANVGDSRAVLCDKNGIAHNLTTDHKPDSEKEKKRIEASGGWVSFLGVWRVAGILATSRALGDAQLKRLGYLTCLPDIQTLDLAILKPQFLILASDGLWDVISAEEAVQVVKRAILVNDPGFGSKALVELALKRFTMDNVSVMVIMLSGGA